MSKGVVSQNAERLHCGKLFSLLTGGSGESGILGAVIPVVYLVIPYIIHRCLFGEVAKPDNAVMMFAPLLFTALMFQQENNNFSRLLRHIPFATAAFYTALAIAFVGGLFLVLNIWTFGFFEYRLLNVEPYGWEFDKYISPEVILQYLSLSITFLAWSIISLILEIITSLVTD